VNNIKAASNVVFGTEDVVNDGPAEVIDLLDEIGIESERAAVIMNTVDKFIMLLSMSHAGEDVDLVTLSLKGRSKLRNVDADASDRNGVKRFPA
jgi:hypothetical protein